MRLQRPRVLQANGEMHHGGMHSTRRNRYAEGQGGLLSRPRSLAGKNALRTSFARDSRLVSGFVSILRSLGYTITIRVGRLCNDGTLFRSRTALLTAAGTYEDFYLILVLANLPRTTLQKNHIRLYHLRRRHHGCPRWRIHRRMLAHWIFLGGMEHRISDSHHQMSQLDGGGVCRGGGFHISRHRYDYSSHTTPAENATTEKGQDRSLYHVHSWPPHHGRKLLSHAIYQRCILTQPFLGLRASLALVSCRTCHVFPRHKSSSNT
ncbi:hypothetical protein CCHR01_13380 [Colletotrichum chrysophilum]|uniref:Uncharacterized protein n=1 Tax=Colletotrichum chrysophilum TaxID=1836956 RepID=A0AAD9AAM3_9PEZI|nr:hypothetical protein CCHR01_13380 [Colletotrichum chrysophilum]